MILTAGHDMNTFSYPLKIDLAKGEKSMDSISGQTQILAENDLYVADQDGIMSSILNGPDHRTRISSSTKGVMCFAYGVQNITEQQIQRHLNQIKDYLLIYAPDGSFDDVKIWG